MQGSHSGTEKTEMENRHPENPRRTKESKNANKNTKIFLETAPNLQSTLSRGQNTNMHFYRLSVHTNFTNIYDLKLWIHYLNFS